MSEAPVLELSGITKSFGSVHALRGADFTLRPGEVHALLGENGAGKSTLMHVAYGMISPDAGEIRIDGRQVALRSPREAMAHGLGMVHQHFTSIEALTVRENIALAVGKQAGPPGGWTAGGVTGRLMEGLEPGARVERLSVALRQRLEIVKALATGARILLMDEPSAVLAPSEVEELLALVREFVAAGGSAALITHKLAEVFVAADRVTVLRHGRVTLSTPVAGQTEGSLAEAMIGVGGRAFPTSPVVPRGTPRTAIPVTRLGEIPIHAGELIGVAAVEGNGQRELLRAIAAGQGVSGSVSFVPEDRTTEGLVPALSITENLVLGLGEDSRWAKGIQLDWNAARARTGELIASFGIRAAGPDVLAATLSGGNQQKVVLARALERRPVVLVAENPTRGLDIRATEEVHRRLRAAASEGVAVIVYSTDLDEVLELGQRVMVVRGGKVSEAPPGADRRAVGEMMLGVRRGQG